MMHIPHRITQRGIALVTAILIVALATILAVDVGFKGYLDQRRSSTILTLDHAFELALGAEALAAAVLKMDTDDSKSAKIDHPAEAWATPITQPIDDAEVQAYLEDLQGRFNLNNLLNPDGSVNEDAVHHLERILAALNMDTKWANLIVDWIDNDTTPRFPDGAEDVTYMAETPSYLTANMPITRSSELLALVDFGLENYQKLEPFVTALPIGTPLNVCSAPAEVYGTLASSIQQVITNTQLANNRSGGCFPTIKDLDNMFNADTDYQKIKSNPNALAETSSYFRGNIWITVGTTELSLFSTLNRDSTGKVRTILRSFGTP